MQVCELKVSRKAGGKDDSWLTTCSHHCYSLPTKNVPAAVLPAAHRCTSKHEVRESCVQVCVRKAPRNAGGKDDSWLYYLQRGSMFTHHQKSVIMDAPQVQGVPTAAGSTRIIGFMGGLDLCDGR